MPTYGKHWQGILLRRTYPELQELIKRSFSMYMPTGATWYEQAKEWRWPSGAVLRMRHLDALRDATHYQGHEYQWIGWDEKTQWATLEAYFMLLACLRCSAADVPTKRVRVTANPGGPGHLAFKAYFIDPAPGGYTPIRDPETGAMRMFIPSKVTDNRILLDRDPHYIDRLKRVGSPDLVRMWLEGDWSVTAGAYFPEFGDRHVVRPFEIPDHWIRARCYDHGSAKPFCVGWWAVSDGSLPPYRNGEVIKYREWYGASSPNVGLRLTIDQIAQGILAREAPGEKITYSAADPSIFKEDGGPSIAETFKRYGVYFRPADNSRVAGWEQFRMRLVGHDDRPMAHWFSTCRDAIRTIPAAMHDEHKPEDIDSEGEDHALDSDRYFFVSRPYSVPLPRAKKRPLNEITLDDLWAQQDALNQKIGSLF